MVPSGMTGLCAIGACFLALISSSSAIKCFECTTADPEQEWCQDPFAGSGGSPVNCATVDEREHGVCRKVTTHQYKVEGGDTNFVGTTISRFCGGPEDTDEFHTSGCEELQGVSSDTVDCACQEDGCNSAGGIAVNMVAVVMATAAAILFGKMTLAGL